MACSRAISAPRCASRSRRGAFPGRKPGMRTSRASLRKAASMAGSNSLAGTLTRRRTLLSSSASTVVSMRSGSVTAAPRNPGESAGRDAHRQGLKAPDGEARIADRLAGRFDRREPLDETLEDQLTFHPGEAGAEAEVEAPGEGQVEVVGAGDVEAVGIGEAGRVPVGRGQQGHHGLARGQAGPADLQVLGDVAVDELHPRIEAQEL